MNITERLHWHNLKSNPKELPKATAWYVYKVRSSDDYRITYGYEEITPNNADYWARIPLPFEVKMTPATRVQGEIWS